MSFDPNFFVRYPYEVQHTQNLAERVSTTGQSDSKEFIHVKFKRSRSANSSNVLGNLGLAILACFGHVGTCDILFNKSFTNFRPDVSCDRDYQNPDPNHDLDIPSNVHFEFLS